MRDYLERAAWWVWSLIFGIYFWVFMSVVQFFSTHDWAASIVGAFVGAVIVGLTTGPLTARRQRRVLAATRHLSAIERRAAGKAVTRGPVPADPKVRRAAALMANDQLAEARRSRWLVIAVCILFAALSIFCTITSSAWFLVGVAVFCGVFPLYVWQVRKVRRRELLMLEGERGAG